MRRETTCGREISEDAELSVISTNHSIRSTAIITLDGVNMEARHIQAVSGHKSASTIRTYAKFVPPKKKKQMFDILTLDKTDKEDTAEEPVPKKPKSTPTSTIIKPPTTDPNETDFLDFAPVDNNANDFDLAETVKTIERAENQTKNIQQTLVPTEPKKVQIANPTIDVQTQRQGKVLNNITNNSNMQNYPFLPKMIFPKTNVTINYNFSK